MKLHLHIALLSSLVALAACKKEYDVPPLDYLPEGSVLTIDSLRSMQATYGSFKFSTDVSVYGIITMDENDGNIYKNVYMQDQTGAVNVRLMTGGGVYVGDSVRIALRDVYLSKYNGVLQLDSCDADVNIIKQSSGNSFAPEVVTIDQITALKESELIKLENVQFVSWEQGEKFADKPNLQSKDRTLEDSNGNIVIVRTSGYSSFADEVLPDGNGSIVCIVSHFNGEIQLYIRSYDEVNMAGSRFTGLLALKNFDDDLIESGDWTQQAVTGSFLWETSTAGGAPNPYASISNYDGANFDSECWLISPTINLTGSSSPTLSFDNAYNYTGPTLEVLVSTDYVSGDPSTATWTALSPILSGGGWAWANSGNIDLSSYISANFHVAFKYTGTTTNGSTWELDNIMIKG